MDRPLSMTSASSHTTSTASLHKRNVSSIKPPSKSQSVSAASLFLTNLKLLNLDLLPDWPSLTTLTFSSADSRSRIRATEWSLYQLFRLFDPQMAAEKLQPFFPPLDHLQSINLRAALHRCLNDLKKNGVLGRDTVLRKTMLDDCLGDKFWDLCLSFSSLVLRKVTLEYRPRSLQPIARRYTTAPVSERKERESLLPMAIAHKAALTKVLHTKTRKRESFLRLSSIMTAKEDELLVRLDNIEAGKPIVESPAHAEELEAIEEALGHSTLGHPAVVDAVINGDPVRPGDMLLLQSKHEFLSQLHSPSQALDSRRDFGLLGDLQHRADSQRARVSQWQALYDQLRVHHRGGANDEQTSAAASLKRDLRYDRHHDLNLEDAPRLSPASATQPEPLPTYISRYDEVLTAMREELRRAQNARRTVGRVLDRPLPEQKPSITLDAVAGARNVSLSRTSSRRSISPTIPFRPGLGRRLSSRPRSYQQPRVVSQREPIPFKSELYSPVKSGSNGDISPDRPTSSAVADPPLTPSDERQKDMANHHRESQGSMGTGTVDSGIGLGVDLTASPVELLRATDDDRAFVTTTTQQQHSPDNISKSNVGLSTATRPAQPPSLAERTRLSMAVCQRDTAVAEDASAPDTQTSPAAVPSDEVDTLAARTRMSMSAFSVPSTSRQSSSSSSSPTPAASDDSQSVPTISLPKTRIPPAQLTNTVTDLQERADGLGTLSAVTHNDHIERNITPHEKLFEADAEAASVFKSRPKVATSPLLSPAPSLHDVVDNSLDT